MFDEQPDGDPHGECAAEIHQLESDCMTLALRLFGEDPDTFAPETREVMDRWRPKCMALLSGGYDEAAEARKAEFDAEMRLDAFGPVHG